MLGNTAKYLFWFSNNFWFCYYIKKCRSLTFDFSLSIYLSLSLPLCSPIFYFCNSVVLKKNHEVHLWLQRVHAECFALYVFQANLLLKRSTSICQSSGFFMRFLLILLVIWTWQIIELAQIILRELLPCGRSMNLWKNGSSEKGIAF